MIKTTLAKVAVFLVAYVVLRTITFFLGRRALWLLVIGVVFVAMMRACIGC